MAVPVLSPEAMRALEADTWASGVSEAEVIARVGREVGRRTMEATRVGDHILLLTGKGHNGDDVRASIPWIRNRRVTLLHLTQPDRQVDALFELLRDRVDLVVDGLFGIGLNRPLEGAWFRIVDGVNACPVRTVAMDIPSGLHAGTGQPLGVAVRADATWTVGAVKSGMLAPEAANDVGAIHVIQNVGLIEPRAEASVLYYGLPSDFLGFPPKPMPNSHKGTHGCVVIWAGSQGYHGAAVLAARGATRARPGLVELGTHASAYPAVAASLQNVMVHPVQKHLLIPPKATSVLVGPGLASGEIPSEWRAQVAELWESGTVPMTVDASALDWLPVGVEPSGNALRVITPHPGEAARMLGCSTMEVQKDRCSALRQLSKRYGNCYVVLKGHHSLIGRSEGILYVNPSGNPSLAQGGSGDILAGYIGGCLARPDALEDPMTALRYAVWRHGHVADLLEAQGIQWEISELAARL